MKTYLFFDRGTNKLFTITGNSVFDAILESLNMVIDGVAVHPDFLGEVES